MHKPSQISREAQTIGACVRGAETLAVARYWAASLPRAAHLPHPYALRRTTHLRRTCTSLPEGCLRRVAQRAAISMRGARGGGALGEKWGVQWEGDQPFYPVHTGTCSNSNSVSGSAQANMDEVESDVGVVPVGRGAAAAECGSISRRLAPGAGAAATGAADTCPAAASQ
ncbi:jg24950 [Pararge aegeria aegeria]|uniref:Jg24950 protein n=1 Tax=Pararge aegeria aegeria TaxID=348720 RepID=A0A8S4QVK2_9NEOP|nr:jg24950 [Pararge aegeria aegeria]